MDPVTPPPPAPAAPPPPPPPPQGARTTPHEVLSLWLIVAALAVGVLLSPAMLGRVAPAWHATLFRGSDAEAQAQLDEAEQNFEARRAVVESTGATDVALDEARAQLQRDVAPYVVRIAQAEAAHAAKMQGLTLALVLGAMALLVGRAWVRDDLAAALDVAASALLALWLVVVIADGRLPTAAPWGLVGLMVAAAALVAWATTLRRRG